jgi:hypothetical protein
MSMARKMMMIWRKKTRKRMKTMINKLLIIFKKVIKTQIDIGMKP